MSVGHRSQLSDPGRVAEHVHRDDRPGPRGDPRLDVGRVEVECFVDLSEDRPCAGVDDRRDCGYVGEARHDNLVTGPDPQPD